MSSPLQWHIERMDGVEIRPAAVSRFPGATRPCEGCGAEDWQEITDGPAVIVYPPEPEDRRGRRQRPERDEPPVPLKIPAVLYVCSGCNLIRWYAWRPEEPEEMTARRRLLEGWYAREPRETVED